MPLDERKELLLEVIEQGRPKESVAFPRVGLFNWGPRCVHAAFMILCRAEPKTALRSLRDEDGIYTTKHAARVLLDSFVGLYPTTESRVKVMDMLRHCCYDKQEDIINKAMEVGFDPNELDDKTAAPSRSDSRNGTPVFVPRQLVRLSTDDELERLQKKQRILELQR